MVIQPNLTASEALKLCQRLSKKIKNLDYDRAFHHTDCVELKSDELYELAHGLEKLEERLQWGV